MASVQTVPDGANVPMTAVDRFQIQKLLGEGASGRVYLARDPVLDRQVALKIPRFADHDPQRRERFLREAKACGRLRHPAIVAVFEGGQSGDDLYIASEYVEGSPLSTFLAAPRSDFRQAVAWVRQVADALAYAHGEGIIHRDVKPGNILIDATDRPRLMDFGLAKRLTEDSGLTTEGSLLGTPAYMSPEQAQGESHEVGPHSDQYSLGVVLYELLTGRVPFEGPLHVVIPSVINEVPPAPRRIEKRIPRALEVICLKCLAKAPSGRYPSCGELGDDLERWLRGEPISARRTPAWELAWHWARKHRVAAALSAAVILLLAGIAAISSAAAFNLARDRAEIGNALVEATRQQEQEQEQERLANEQLRIAEDQSRRASTHARNSREAERQVAEALALLQEDEARLDVLRSKRESAVQLTAESEATTEGTDERAKRAQEDFREMRDKLKVADSLTHYVKTLELVTRAIDAQEYDQACVLLAECDGKQRGWEWDYLRGRSDGQPASCWTAADVAVKSCAAPGRHQRYARFSPDAKRLACIDAGHRIKVLNAATGELLRTLISKNDKVDNRRDENLFDIEISPDNGRLAVLSPRTVVVWNLATGAVVSSHSNAHFDNLVLGYRPNGSLLVVSHETLPGGSNANHAAGQNAEKLNFHLSVWDGEIGTKSRSISPVGQGILAKVDTLNLIFTPRDGLLFVRRSNFFLTGARYDGEHVVRLNLASGECDVPTPFTLPIDISVANDPTGRRVISDEGIVEVAAGRTLLPLSWLLKGVGLASDGEPSSFSWSPDGKRIALQVGETIRVVTISHEPVIADGEP